MKILHLLASPVFSGPAESVALLALEQRKLGHDVHVAVDRKRSGLGSEEPAAPRLQALGLLDEGGLELCVKSTPWAMLQDLRKLHARELDVVHSHFSHDHVLARMAKPKGAVLIRSLHAPRSLRRSMPSADAFTVPYAEELPRLDGRKGIRLLPLVGPEFQSAASPSELRVELSLPGSPLIVMASTFQSSRRHDLALRAFELLLRDRPNARLVFLGDGVEESALRARAGSLPVTFAGYQKGEAFARYLSAMDELWVLGLGNDWSGRIAAQAKACGLRVIAARQGGLPDLADLTLDTVTPEALAAASLRAQSESPRPLPTRQEIAQQVLALYQEAA